MSKDKDIDIFLTDDTQWFIPDKEKHDFKYFNWQDIIDIDRQRIYQLEKENSSLRRDIKFIQDFLRDYPVVYQKLFYPLKDSQDD